MPQIAWIVNCFNGNAWHAQQLMEIYHATGLNSGITQQCCPPNILHIVSKHAGEEPAGLTDGTAHTPGPLSAS